MADALTSAAVRTRTAPGRASKRRLKVSIAQPIKGS
jgi:hypothetical protein